MGEPMTELTLEQLVDRAVTRMRLPPYPHQLQAMYAMSHHSSFGLFMAMRTGKSKVVVDFACMKHVNGEIDALVVVAPASVYRTWTTDQLPAHVWEDLPHTIETWKSGAGKKQREAYAALFRSRGLAILVVNTEALDTKACVEYMDGFLKHRRTMLAIDESACIKNPGAACTKRATRMGLLAPYRVILTGTPVSQGPLDLYAQLEFLDKGLSGFRSYHAFKACYAVQAPQRCGPRTFLKVTGFRNLARLKRQLESCSISVRLEDVRENLPPRLYQTVEVPMTAEHRATYEQLRRTAVLKVGDDAVVSAPMAMSLLTKLHQAACGYVLRDDGEVMFLSPGRVLAVMDVLSRTTGKAVIYATQHYAVEQLVEAISTAYGRESVVHYYGKTPEAERDAARARFQDDPACRFFVGTQAAASESLDLSAANMVVYHSNTYSLRHRLQSEARPFGPRQQDPVLIVDLVTPGTVDEKVVAALKSKTDIADLLRGGGLKRLLGDCGVLP